MRIPGLDSSSIRPVTLPSLAGEKTTGASGSVFGEVLGEAVARVQSFEAQSHQSLERFLNGESEEIHQVALDAQRASLQFEFFLQMRNKVVQAYQEIMRQQL